MTGSEPGTEGGTTATTGVNGSRARLPYGLDPARVAVLGSWRSGVQQPAAMRSAWYRLPQRTEGDDARPLLVVSAAGRFDQGEVQVQWATDEQAARNEPGGAVAFGDVGAAPAWRNLRAPLSAIPREATQIRLVATDDDLAPQHWMAVTPPRIPQLRTLQDVVGSQDPVMLDWLVGLAFPCQRPFGHDNGVVEAPKWRILPDRFGAEANSPVMDYLGGGPLGITELLFRAEPVPTYLEGRLVPGLGCASAAGAVLPERPTRPPGTGYGHPQRLVESRSAPGVLSALGWAETRSDRTLGAGWPTA